MTTQTSYGTPATKKMRTDHGSAPNSTPGTPQLSQSKAGTPVPTWNASQIPIDPALQQATGSTPAPVGSTPSTPNPQGQSSAPVSMSQNMSYMVNRNNYQHYTAYGGNSAYYHVPQYQFQPNSTPTYVQAPTQASVPPKPSQQQPQPQPTQQIQQAPEQDNNVDVSTLNDAIGVAGLDLKAEEENLQRSQDLHPTYRNVEDRSRKQPPFPAFDTRVLGATMRTVGTNHKVNRIPDDAVNYLALALRARLQTLIEGMIFAAQHRTRAQFDREPGMFTVEGEEIGEDGEKSKTPMWNVVVRRDTRKILELLERVEREEEMRVRRERRERIDAAEAAASQPPPAANSPVIDGSSPSVPTSGAGGDDAASVAGGDGTSGQTQAKKPKKKKDGPGVTARNMSEDVQKRLSNAVATQAAGLGRGRYSWMNAGGGGAGSSPTKLKKEASKSTVNGPSNTNASAASSGAEAATSTTTMNGTASAPGVQNQPAASSSQPATATSAPGSSWAKPYISAAQKAGMGNSFDSGDEDKTFVTLRDAMFVIERERGHGGGRGAARAWV